MHYLKRFNDIDYDYVYTDKHIHSCWVDGEGQVVEIAKKAAALNLKLIAITEHVRADSRYFPEYLKDIDSARRQVDITILAGGEAKICNFCGDVDMAKNIFNKVDIKIASVHRFPMGRKLYEPQQFNKSICQEIELELAIQALKRGGFNVLGHPGGMSLSAYKEFPLSFFEEIITECKANNIGFEINSRYHQSVFDDLIILLKKHNPLVSLGSDAHRIIEIGDCVKLFQ